MAQTMTRGTPQYAAWQQGYEAALNDLERIAEDLQDRAEGLDFERSTHMAEALEYALKLLRARLAAANEPEPVGLPTHPTDLPPQATDREYTEG